MSRMLEIATLTITFGGVGSCLCAGCSRAALMITFEGVGSCLCAGCYRAALMITFGGVGSCLCAVCHLKEPTPDARHCRPGSARIPKKFPVCMTSRRLNS